MQHALKRFIDIQGHIEMGLSMVLLMVIIGTISFQIIARYVFNAPVPWMEEVVTIPFILLTLLAAAVADKETRTILVHPFPQGQISRVCGSLMSLTTSLTLVSLIAHILPFPTLA